MAVIDNAYNYYLTTYGSRSGTRYDVHKKSELRSIYNKIIQINKDTPLYKFQSKGDITKFAIDIKEGAQNIKNVVASLSGSEDIMKAFQKKIAYSSEEDIVSADYIGKSEDFEASDSFQIEVRQLAKPQVNLGNFLKSSRCDLSPDTYSFDLENTSTAYEFQFSVNSSDTNLSIQTKLAELISHAGIGLTASVISDEQGSSALKIESDGTGLEPDKPYLFKINAGGNINSVAALRTLGIDQVSQEALNSKFLLNGSERSSRANTFSINNMFELNLLGISPEGESSTIGFKASSQAVTENVQALIDSYNNMLKTTAAYSETQSQSGRLLHQIGSVADHYRSDLEEIGLNTDENGLLSINQNTLTSVIESDQPQESLSVLNSFKNALNTRASMAVLNPMEYVDKLIVAYKNPGRNFPSPYVSSIYSGMLLDRSC